MLYKGGGKHERARTRGEPRIRRAGNAFVHRPDRPSAYAYGCSGGFVLPAPRARRSGTLAKKDVPIKAGAE